MTARVNPGLKALVVEASRALAVLDAERLEELALACQALNLPLRPDRDLARQAREARDEMEVFARVLEVTRANLEVMRRLRDLREGRAGYGDRVWTRAGAVDGHD